MESGARRFSIRYIKVVLEKTVPNSKRAILSVIARLYDPLGRVTPATVSAKIVMQQLWRLQIDWDEQVPESILARWQLLYSKLPHLNQILLARWTRTQPESRLKLHGFADASTRAYAAVVYLRTITPAGNITVSLLAGKSRVAPITPLTVPRLELSAALILSCLLVFARTSIRFL